jgi:tyrosyl-tRNA synthetase
MEKPNEILTRSVTNIIPSKKVLQKLLNGKKKLNVYLGIDPTATRIHLGNAVPLRKLRSFVELGHHVTFLIGDFTALIGDTSDKVGERPVLTYEQIQENFKSYKKQASKLIDFSKVKIDYNSTWLKDLAFADIVKLCQQFTLNDFISRELIKKRLDESKSVRLHEVLYPVMQGYDSYHMNTDIQIGGADQTFNMQAGRKLQKNLRNKESAVIVTDYLEGTDGRKMSKSWGNAIWLDDSPNDIFGKVMSLRDDLIINYFTLGTDLSLEEIEKNKIALHKAENPMSVKKQLAYQIVKELHSESEAKSAEEYFKKTVQKGELPDASESVRINADLTLVDVIAKVIGSKSEAKRLLQQNAIEIDGKVITDASTQLVKNATIKIGKKIFIKAVQ